MSKLQSTGLRPRQEECRPYGGSGKQDPRLAGLAKETLAPPGGGKATARPATLPESPQGMTENSHGRQPVGPKV